MTELRVVHVAASESIPGWPLGEALACKASGETTGGSFALFELRSPEGTGSGPHVHYREDEALYVLDGEYEIRDLTNDRTITAMAGSYVFLPRGTRHAFRNSGGRPARMLVLAVPAGLEGFFKEVAATPDQTVSTGEKYGIEFGAGQSS